MALFTASLKGSVEVSGVGDSAAGVPAPGDNSASAEDVSVGRSPGSVAVESGEGGVPEGEVLTNGRLASHWGFWV